ncbi:MAG TPA: hypothetical protein VFV02_14615 [Acidimicrobiales bacterium]|nr:hypothetical protein [Acidimicrobiales bacterium]
MVVDVALAVGVADVEGADVREDPPQPANAIPTTPTAAHRRFRLPLLPRRRAVSDVTLLSTK